MSIVIIYLLGVLGSMFSSSSLDTSSPVYFSKNIKEVPIPSSNSMSEESKESFQCCLYPSRYIFQQWQFFSWRATIHRITCILFDTNGSQLLAAEKSILSTTIISKIWFYNSELDSSYIVTILSALAFSTSLFV